jgi:hypothetical protein
MPPERGTRRESGGSPPKGGTGPQGSPATFQRAPPFRFIIAFIRINPGNNSVYHNMTEDQRDILEAKPNENCNFKINFDNKTVKPMGGEIRIAPV